MGIATGFLDPKLSPKEASEMIFKAYPEAKKRLDEGMRKYAETSIFRAYIVEQADAK